MIPLKGILTNPDKKYRSTVASIKLVPILEDHPNLLDSDDKKQKIALTVLNKILSDNEYVVEEIAEGEK